jgi:hypothetical protein
MTKKLKENMAAAAAKMAIEPKKWTGGRMVKAALKISLKMAKIQS